MGLPDVIGIFSRWVHVASAIILLGGVIFARAVRHAQLFREYRALATAAIAALFLSGLYNLLTKANTPTPYHMIFGIKFLLALHVFGVGLMSTRATVDETTRQRWLTGVAVSGLAVTLLSAYLRWLSR